MPKVERGADVFLAERDSILRMAGHGRLNLSKIMPFPNSLPLLTG
jgi:hypothetical protein